MIVICFVIQSSITVLLNNSLSLLEKLESKYAPKMERGMNPKKKKKNETPKTLMT